MERGQTESRRFGVAVTISTGCRNHLQRRSGTFTVESGVSFVLRQFLISRAPRPQLVTQFSRVLHTFLKLSHLLNERDTARYNFKIICTYTVSACVLNIQFFKYQTRDSYLSLIDGIPLISEIPADRRSLVETSRSWPRSLRFRRTFNRVMMSSGSRSALIRYTVFTIQRVRLISSHYMIMWRHGMHARQILATGSILVDLSGRLDPVK